MSLLRWSFAYLCAQLVIVARLTFYELSWDILEPITYCLGFLSVLLGMGYFLKYDVDYTYESLLESLQTRRAAKVFKRKAFPIEWFEEAKRERDETESFLRLPEFRFLSGE